ncbi:hypothetical protein OIV83_005199 [Microbotryomycetes sp. JL201]|nr:hypothetical protein OIV83_005199 [Microbotryomycetes sp. JL201]
MSISAGAAYPGKAPDASTSLLATLQAFQRAQETRRSLQNELESALSSFLTDTPSAWSNGSAISVNGHSHAFDGAANGTTSTCAREAAELRPPTSDEMTQVLDIGMRGLLDVRLEMQELQTLLRETWKRNDLARILSEVESLEQDRLKHTIERDQMRRLSAIEPDRDFSEAIAAANAKRSELASRIEEEAREIAAEIADASAA